MRRSLGWPREQLNECKSSVAIKMSLFSSANRNVNPHGWKKRHGNASRASLTSDRLLRRLTLDRSTSPILPTVPAPDLRFLHAELAPDKF